MESPDQNFWPDLKEFLVKRIKQPMGHPSYWFYFFLVVVGIGGIGVWKAVFEASLQSFASNLMTFFPAVAGASAFEIVLNKDGRVPKSAQTGTLFLGGILIVAIIFIWVDDKRISAAFVGAFSAILSLILWWIANADNDALLDSRPGKEAFGGEANSETKGELGGIKG